MKAMIRLLILGISVCVKATHTEMQARPSHLSEVSDL